MYINIYMLTYKEWFNYYFQLYTIADYERTFYILIYTSHIYVYNDKSYVLFLLSTLCCYWIGKIYMAE